MAASKWIKCFGLQYTVCFDLSCIDRRGFMFGLFCLQVIQSGFLTMATQIKDSLCYVIIHLNNNILILDIITKIN